MTDVFIIGKGPAGISASLYAVRAGLSIIVTGKDMGALGKTEKIENYYGFAEPISGEKLFNDGIAGAKRLGAEILDEEVFDISYDETFTITTNKNQYKSKSVILASGTSRKAPPIKGIKEYEGRGVSYCAVCDAFFYRNMNVAVIGNEEYAISEVMHLLPTSAKVTLLTNGRELKADFNSESIDNENKSKFTINIEKIAEIAGEKNGTVNSVIFEDGSRVDVDGVFIAEGTASGTDLGRKLGIVDMEGKLMINPDMSTFVPGLFAAGDCTGGLRQISKAVYEGALAGTGAVKFVRKSYGNIS